MSEWVSAGVGVVVALVIALALALALVFDVVVAVDNVFALARECSLSPPSSL